MASELATTIRLIREAKNVSIAEAAHAIGALIHNYISMEDGERGLSEHDIDRLAVVLKCPVTALLAVSRPQPYRDSATVAADVATAVKRLRASMERLRESLEGEDAI